MPSYQLNSQFQSQHSEPFQYSFQPHSYSYPPRTEPPTNVFQIIQHPRGISSTKQKITKNMPSYPILSADTQEHTCASHCACGTILPVYRPDQGSWRLMDSARGRFRRRLVGDLVGDIGIGNVDVPIFVGGIWSRDSVPLAVPEVPWGLLPSIEHLDSCS